MDPVDLIIASLNVRGAFPNTPWLLLEAVWKRMCLPFYNFASDYIRTRKYTVRTGAGLTPFLEPGSGVPQGGAEGPFLYLIVTLPLARTIEQDYPASAPYSLLSPLVGFADDTNLTVAHTRHEPHTPNPGLTVTQQANDLLDVIISYHSENNLIIHPTELVAMIKGSTTAPTLGPQGPPMHVVETTTHLGVIQTATPEHTTLPRELQSNLADLPGYASHQGPLPIPTELGVLLHQGLERLRRLPGTPPDTPHHRPPASHTRRHQGRGSTGQLANLHTHWRHPGGMAPLWGRHRGRGESGLHQTHRPPPSPHDTQQLAGSLRSRQDPPPSRTTGPGHKTTLDTPPDGHANPHEHAPVEPAANSPPFHAPRHTHQPHMPGGRTLAVLCGDLHHHPKGTINTIDLVGASITVVYDTLPQIRVLHRSGAHRTPFLQIPEWPQYRLFHQYLTQTARTAGHTLLGSKDMKAAYRDFEKQQPPPIPATPPYAPNGSKHEPVPPVTGPVPPLTLLLAPNKDKPSSTTGQNGAYRSTT